MPLGIFTKLTDNGKGQINPSHYREKGLPGNRQAFFTMLRSSPAPADLLTTWVDNGFLVIADPARKSRKYGLADECAEAVR